MSSLKFSKAAASKLSRTINFDNLVINPGSNLFGTNPIAHLYIPYDSSSPYPYLVSFQ